MRKLKNLKRTGILFMLTLAMLVTSVTITPVRVEAASSSYIYRDSYEMGINETLKAVYYLEKRSKASYTFKSSKSSVAKVNSKGTITGLNAGTAKIKVTEKYKGKTKSIGTIKVKVYKARIEDYAKQEGFYVYTQLGYYGSNTDYSMGSTWGVEYDNPKATYKVYSSDSGKLSITTKGIIKKANGVDGDTVTITVKETYKGKTRKVGTYKAIFKDASIDSETTWEVGEYYEVPIWNSGQYWFVFTSTPWTDAEITDFQNGLNSDSIEEDTTYSADDIIKFTRENSEADIVCEAKKTGTGYFYFYLYNYDTKEYYYSGKYTKVNVVERIEDDYDDDYDDFFDYDDDDE